MSLTKRLGLKIRYCRKQKRFSQEELAERCGLHPTYIGQVERGEKNITVESLSRISSALEITMAELFQDVEASAAPTEPVQLSFYKKLCRFPVETQEQVYKILLEIMELL